MPQRLPTIDEMSAEARVLHVHAALETARADLARLPEAEGALAELLAVETIGETVDPGALDAAELDAANCQQARGLVTGLERRLDAALDVYREHETARLRERADARQAEQRHLQASHDALAAQLGEVVQKLTAARAAAQAALGEWAAMPHRTPEQLLRRVMTKAAEAEAATATAA
jgi:hypothetical protein